MARTRQEQILEWLERVGVGSYQELADFLSVSTMTVRRDVDDLNGRGLVIKTLGGVQRANAPSYLMETEQNRDLSIYLHNLANGAPIKVDTTSPQAKAAIARGTELANRKIGELNFACTDCHGKVASAKVAKGLGHGLDEAALTAIRKTEFEAAPRCAPGFQKSMKINYAFRLGD